MQRPYSSAKKNLTAGIHRHVVAVRGFGFEKRGPMTRDSGTCEEPHPALVLAGMASKKKAVTFDDWLRSDDGRYAVLQDVLVASDDECEWTMSRLFLFFFFEVVFFLLFVPFSFLFCSVWLVLYFVFFVFRSRSFRFGPRTEHRRKSMSNLFLHVFVLTEKGQLKAFKALGH